MRMRLVAAVLAWSGMVGVCLGQDFREGSSGRAKTPHPALVVLNKDANELAIVDPETLKVVGRVPTGPVPHEVAVSEDGKIAVVTNYGAHQDGTTLSLIDLDAQREIHRVDLGVGVGPHGVEFYEEKAWFTAEGGHLIGRYDPKAKRVDHVIPVGRGRTHMLVVAQDGKTIYASNITEDMVTFWDAGKMRGFNETLGVRNGDGVIAVGKGPEGIDISPDGKEVWAANSGDGTVSIIDTATKKVIETVDVKTKRSNRLKFAPDGKLVLISDLGAGDLVVLEAATRKEVTRIHLGKSVEGILVQPHGWRAYVAVSGDDRVAVVDLKALEEEMARGKVVVEKMPDGERVVRPSKKVEELSLKTQIVLSTFETGKDPDGMAWAK